MKITKLEHSGIIIEKDGRRVVFDPVEIKGKIPKLENVVAIVVTHMHGDHLQPEVITRIRRDNPAVKIFTTSDTVSLIEDAISVKSGDSFEVDGFKLDFFGENHADIIPGQTPCENIGVVVDDRIINPGDSFDRPNTKADVLCVAISAPWLKIVESMNYVKSIRPKTVVPMHDALLSEFGESVIGSWMKKACDEVGADYKELRPGESITESRCDFGM